MFNMELQVGGGNLNTKNSMTSSPLATKERSTVLQDGKEDRDKPLDKYDIQKNNHSQEHLSKQHG